MDKQTFELIKELELSIRNKKRFYRNFPNKRILRYIYRKKPSYLNRPKRVFCKYELKRLEEEKYFNNRNFPNTYLQDEIVLMPKNGNSLFVYWEISQDTHNRVNKDEYVIKLEGSKEIEIKIKDRNSSMFITNLLSGGRYIAKLAYYNQGKLEIIAQSNDVITANLKESDDLTTMWAKTQRIENDDKVKIIFDYGSEYNLQMNEELKKEKMRYLGSSELVKG